MFFSDNNSLLCLWVILINLFNFSDYDNYSSKCIHVYFYLFELYVGLISCTKMSQEVWRGPSCAICRRINHLENPNTLGSFFLQFLVSNGFLPQKRGNHFLLFILIHTYNLIYETGSQFATSSCCSFVFHKALYETTCMKIWLNKTIMVWINNCTPKALVFFMHLFKQLALDFHQSLILWSSFSNVANKKFFHELIS